MVCLRLPGGSCMAALTVTLMVLSSPLALAGDTRRGRPCDRILRVPTARFLEQGKSECHFFNGTERVRFLERHFYNQEELVRFDSDVGEYRAVTELGRPDAVYWNSQKDYLEQKRGQVDNYCRHNYGVGESFTVQRRGARSESAQSKMLSGVGGFVLGLLFLGAGLFIYFRNQKGHSGLQPTGLLS
ncbi:PREDICTED: HLA class II histocompatibility antigen, DRB1-4 beta chain-like [Mandrillus leucophaeus]|uniref:HLA class II histocompatibility antigen, DRB1-4 beta chain-like n=1 Tax=Mandrillus leucophaeus TaxID=9568 RepID=UPI0005F48993|nr:PREDICTED: HLA class II histocompatibility antigen, DRB1-4 beta chain-like [Mandrillus leucophaeus]